MIRSSDILVIGSGPSGLLFSLIASKRHHVTLIESDKRQVIAKRILVSGNGRCNFFNDDLLDHNFYDLDENRSLKDIVLDDKDYAKEVLSYLDKLCFPYVKEDKLYYPFFNRAESLHNLLLEEVKKSDIDILYTKAIKIDTKNKIVNCSDLDISYNTLVIAIGGKSYDRESYNPDLLKPLNLKIKQLRPALCPIKTVEKIPNYLVGNRVRCKLSLYKRDDLLYEERGEIIFKKDGLSGISIFDSTIYINKQKDFKDIRIHLDILDGCDKKINIDSIPTFLRRYLKEKDIKIEDGLDFNFSSLYTFKESQITCGGISLNEIDLHTMRLKNNRDILAIGELLDINMICGGYNIGMSLIEGYKAGDKIDER